MEAVDAQVIDDLIGIAQRITVGELRLDEAQLQHVALPVATQSASGKVRVFTSA